jgi:hypothetical protein
MAEPVTIPPAAPYGTPSLLPAELRNAIFEMVLIEEDSKITFSDSLRSPGLVGTCRTIRVESLPVYYLRNTIVARRPCSSSQKFFQFLDKIVADFTDMGIKQCPLRVTVSYLDEMWDCVLESDDDFLRIADAGIRLKMLCREKGFVVE